MKLFGRRQKSNSDVCCLGISPFGIAHLRGRGAVAVKEHPSRLFSVSDIGFQAYPQAYPDEKTMLEQLKQVAKKSGYRDSSCLVVLSSDYYRLLLIDRPANMKDNELHEALPWMVKDLIDYPAEEALLSFFPVPSSDGQPEKLYVAIAKRAILSSLHQQLVAAEFDLVCIDIAEMTMHYLLSQFDASCQGANLLFLNDNDHLVIASRGESLYLARSMDQGISQSSEVAQQLDIWRLELRRFLDYAQFQLESAEPVPLYVATTKTDQAKQLLTDLSNPSHFVDLSVFFELQQDYDQQLINRNFLAFGGALRAMEF